MNLAVGYLERRYYWRPVVLLRPDPCSAFQPPPPGQKRQKEDWENVWVIGMFGTMGLAMVLLYYKPDTRFAGIWVIQNFLSTTHVDFSIQTWALKEAKERMEARGEKYEYKPSSQ
jgi:hypothetical protein